MRFIAVLLVVTALAGCMAEPNTTGTFEPGRIDGTVIDFMGQPYANATVLLVELDRTDNATRYGGFTFASVNPGVYNLYAFPEGALEPIEERVHVAAGQQTVVFLRAPRDPVPDDYVSALGKSSVASLAVGGAECSTCAWTTRLGDDAQEVVVQAEWHDAYDGSARVEVLDGWGNLVLRLEGKSPLWGSVLIEDIVSDDPHLMLKYYFGPDVLPQTNYAVDTTMDVYYGRDREQRLDESQQE